MGYVPRALPVVPPASLNRENSNNRRKVTMKIEDLDKVVKLMKLVRKNID